MAAVVVASGGTRTGTLNKEEKYDRQLRLWGDHGQEALEAARVCLINASATGTEILKNLVLPGIGAFTIVDGNIVAGEDVGNNFFLTKDSIGKNRAQAATELLQELNSDVSGNSVDESVEQLLENDPTFFHGFSIVIATQLPESSLLHLSNVLWAADVPLLVCRTYGLVGYMRLAVKEHPVVESHPDNALEDLRLDKPFPQLKRHVQEYDLDNMDKKDHSHTPWIILVAKYLEKWRQEHNNQLPKTYKEKEAFRELIRQGLLKNDEGTPVDEENFDEAIKNVNTALNPTKVPSNVQELFEDQRCANINTQVATKHKFKVQKFSILDLNTSSETVCGKGGTGESTCTWHRPRHDSRLHPVHSATEHPPETISEKDIWLFCRNAAFLRLVCCRSLAEEFNPETTDKDQIASCMENLDSEMVLYILLRAVDCFHKQHGRYPGVYNNQVEEDIGKLKSCVISLLQDWGVSVSVKDDYIHEFCRYGASEPHAVASFLGGTAAQEAIKIITKQFVPFNNTFIYNAMLQTSMTVRL
ncbi:NEDD8-activating enzyme E1 regulatory subunit isoform X2 [Mobula birostris]|uniref:NEDD8-activating enzyme E1 regulatory subunit isoform X2 n=1 Tax=Mobula birostris TaxID=1983395 RepID=UPI003B284DD3